MEQYIAERQYSDIFSTLQILIAMTPYDIRYMANTPLTSFNRAFAFNWQEEDDAKPVRSWKQFSEKVLSIPMAHDMATRYMVLDGTKNKENIKVMRPYQVYATKKVLDKVRTFDFQCDEGRLGYIWHTTGSGKTITSFKTAWLASRMPNVDKVVFLVDRIALTKKFDMETVKSYMDDLVRRLNRTSDDGQFLDLLIVVDQLLTGFDAPELNTLYIDRTLKGANLIQAYSRTNRIHHSIDKPKGNVVNYRWPVQNEYEMNRAMDYAQLNTNIQLIANHIRKWGLDNSVSPKDLTHLIEKHREGQEDLDKQGELTTIINDARAYYSEIADKAVAKLSWIRYRRELRSAFYKLADEIKKGE